MAQVLGSLTCMWETQLESRAPGFWSVPELAVNKCLGIEPMGGKLCFPTCLLNKMGAHKMKQNPRFQGWVSRGKMDRFEGSKLSRYVEHTALQTSSEFLAFWIPCPVTEEQASLLDNNDAMVCNSGSQQFTCFNVHHSDLVGFSSSVR